MFCNGVLARRSPARVCAIGSGPTRQSVQPSKHVVRSAEKIKGLDYKTAGVDIDAGNELVRRIKALNPDIGGFSGLYPFGACLKVLQKKTLFFSSDKKPFQRILDVQACI